MDVRRSPRHAAEVWTGDNRTTSYRLPLQFSNEAMPGLMQSRSPIVFFGATRD
jgi:hypothetical protein